MVAQDMIIYMGFGRHDDVVPYVMFWCIILLVPSIHGE